MSKTSLLLSKFENAVGETFNIENIFDLNGHTKFILLKHKKYVLSILVVLGERYFLKKNNSFKNIINMTSIDNIPLNMDYVDDLYKDLNESEQNFVICSVSTKGLYFPQTKKYFLLYEEGKITSQTEKLIRDAQKVLEEDSFFELEDNETENYEDDEDEESVNTTNNYTELIFMEGHENVLSQKDKKKPKKIGEGNHIPIEILQNIDCNIGNIIITLNMNTFYSKLNPDKISYFLFDSYEKIKNSELIVKNKRLEAFGSLFDQAKESLISKIKLLIETGSNIDVELKRITNLISSIEDTEKTTKTKKDNLPQLKSKSNLLMQELVITKITNRDTFVNETNMVKIFLDFLVDQDKYKLE